MIILNNLKNIINTAYLICNQSRIVICYIILKFILLFGLYSIGLSCISDVFNYFFFSIILDSFSDVFNIPSLFWFLKADPWFDKNDKLSYYYFWFL